MVDVVGDVGGEAPVVGRVLEDVHDRHRRVGEAVHEDRLQEPFGVVERPAGRGDARKSRRFFL